MLMVFGNGFLAVIAKSYRIDPQDRLCPRSETMNHLGAMSRIKGADIEDTISSVLSVVHRKL